MKVLAATNNAGKLKELRRILERMGHTVVSPKELGMTLDPDETGATFAENARIKAEAFCQASGLPTVADDSGLCVEALGGAPGVYSARYCGRHGDDPANNRKLLQNLATYRKGRAAQSLSRRCACCCPAGPAISFWASAPARIGFAEQGTNGFGYDPLFIPDRVGLPDGSTAPNAQGRTYAQLTDGEKDAISHRGRAMAAMAEALPQILAGA